MGPAGCSNFADCVIGAIAVASLNSRGCSCRSATPVGSASLPAEAAPARYLVGLPLEGWRSWDWPLGTKMACKAN